MDGGGNANVFAAENVRGETVAIKILREEGGNGKRTEKRNRLTEGKIGVLFSYMDIRCLQI